MEADLRCSSAIQSMEKRLRAACHASDANIDNVVKVSTHFLVLKHVKCLEEKIIFWHHVLLLTRSFRCCFEIM